MGQVECHISRLSRHACPDNAPAHAVCRAQRLRRFDGIEGVYNPSCIRYFISRLCRSQAVVVNRFHWPHSRDRNFGEKIEFSFSRSTVRLDVIEILVLHLKYHRVDNVAGGLALLCTRKPKASRVTIARFISYALRFIEVVSENPCAPCRRR